MSHPANDILNESMEETIDRIEADLELTREFVERMRPVVEAADGFIHAAQAAHHGPAKRLKKDTLHRLFEEVEKYREWDYDL